MGATDDSGIGTRLRAARERLGWSREELAFHSGVSWSAISQAESGRRRNLRPQTLSRLSNALHVSIDYLVNGGPTPPMLTHLALMYDDNESFAEGAGRFLLAGIARSEAGIAVTTEANLAVLRDYLGSDAERVEFVESTDGYLTPEEILDLFTGFQRKHLERGSVWVRVVSEGVWAGRTDAEVRLWTRYESLLNLVLGGSPMSVLCPYNTSALDPAVVSGAHVTHPHVVEGGSVKDSREFRDPGKFALEP